MLSARVSRGQVNALRYSSSNQQSLRAAFACILGLLSFWLSTHLLSLYTGGDRFWYGRFYEVASTIPLVPDINAFSELQLAQKNYTGSGEPLYGVLVWIAAHYISNGTFINISNAVLASALAFLLVKHKAGVISIILLFTNYYYFVLLTSAERLKLAIICVVIAALLNKTLPRFVLFLLAPLLHVQSIMLYVPMVIYSTASIITSQTSRSSSRLKGLFVIIVSLIVISAIMIVFRSYILKKISTSSYQSGDLYGVILLTMAAYFTFRNDIKPTIAIASVSIFVLFVGDSRVNIIAYFLYMHYCLIGRKTGDIFFIAISLYMSYKSISYVGNIYAFGTGFM